jgi:hypothetical protein
MEQQQTDAFGVLPQGVLTQDDLAQVGTVMLGKDAYIGRLQRQILALQDALATLRAAPETVVEQAEQIASDRANGAGAKVKA